MRHYRIVLAGLVLFVQMTSISWGQEAVKGEQFQKFLDALRARKLFDVATDYLVDMQRSTLLDDKVKVIIPYEEGQTLIQQAQSERDFNQRLKQLEQAADRFASFIKANQNHELVGPTQMLVGTIEVERGEVAIGRADKASGAEKETLLKEAQAHFAAALKVFTDAETNYAGQLEKIPKFITPDKKQEIQNRENLLRNKLQAQIYAATAVYESSKAYAPNTEPRKKALQDAADRYEKINAEHRGKVVGLLARIKQGQCYQDMEDYRRALGLYADILSQPDEIVELRDLKASAMFLSMQCWTTEKLKMQDVAIAKGEEYFSKIKGADNQKEDNLAIRYYLALAYVESIKTLPANDPLIKKHEERLKVLLADVKKHPNAYQEASIKLLEKYGVAGKGAGDKPTNFVDGFDQAKELFYGMLDQKKAYEEAMANKAAPEAIEQKKQAMLDSRDKALAMFTLALSLRDKDSNIDDINTIRYYQAHMNYMMKRFYDAAVLGEFVTRHYPNSAGGREAARIAMASYLAEYYLARGERDYDRDHLLGIVEYIVKRWPEEEEADNARAIIMAVLVGEHKLTDAAKWLDTIPDGSPNRATSELKLGQAFWSEYLTLQRRETDRPPQAELDKLVADAQKLLESGLDRLKKQEGGEVTAELAAAALSTSQIYVSANEPQKAVALLEDEKIGPLFLLGKEDPAVTQGVIPVETYKIALRAYVGTKSLDKAELMMKKLEEVVSKAGPDGSLGKGDLTKIYISLGQALKEQLEALKLAKKEKEMADISKGYETLLDKIAAREDGNTFGSLNWVAETFYSLGIGQDTEGKPASELCRGYYEKTKTINANMLAKVAKDPKFAPSEDAVLSVKLRQAKVLRRLQKYPDAVTVLAEVLQKRPQLLEAQREACYVFMDWGRELNPEYYRLAVYGAKKDPKTNQNIFWGWSGIGNKLAGDAKFQTEAMNARWQISNCLMLWAEHKATKPDDRAKFLKDAEGNIRVTFYMSREMGGEESKKNFNNLLITLQKLLGQKDPAGLKLFEKANPASGPAQSSPATASPVSAPK